MKSWLDDFISHRLWAQVLHRILYEKTNPESIRIRMNNACSNSCNMQIEFAMPTIREAIYRLTRHDFIVALLLENLWHCRIIKNWSYFYPWTEDFVPCWESAIMRNYLELTPFWLCLMICALLRICNNAELPRTDTLLTLFEYLCLDTWESVILQNYQDLTC